MTALFFAWFSESCQIVRIYAQRHVIPVNAQMLRNAVKRYYKTQ